MYIYIIWGHWNLKETAMLEIFVASRLAGLSLASLLFRFNMVFLRIVQCQGSRPTSEAVHSWKPRWSIWKETHDSPLFFPTSMGATYRNSSLGKVIRSSVHSNAQVLSVGFARDDLFSDVGPSELPASGTCSSGIFSYSKRYMSKGQHVEQSTEHASVYLIVSTVYAFLLLYCPSHWGQKLMENCWQAPEP